MSDTNDLICNQLNCPLALEGVCLEGVEDPHKCPHVTTQIARPSQQGEVESVDDEDAKFIEDTKDWLVLSGGYELTVEEASSITSGFDTRVIVFAGEPDAGKTTLMATIYELISKRAIAKHQLLRTDTILAFERACFPSRVVSGNYKPETVRTKYMRPRFYHLALKSEIEVDAAEKHILLADISGEAFRRASDTEEEAKKLLFIRRADCFVLMIDGARLNSKTERQDLVQRALLIVRALLAVNVLTSASSVQLVLSKIDCLNKEDPNVTEFLLYTRGEFERLCRNAFAEFDIMEIAARPDGEVYPFAHGVEDALTFWLRERNNEPFVPSELRIAEPNDIRECDAFLWRRNPGRP